MTIRCRFGGPAPCIDDLCHGGGQTVCGLDMDFEREIEEEIYGRGQADGFYYDDDYEVDGQCGHPCKEFASFGVCECTVYGSYAAAQRARASSKSIEGGSDAS